MHAEEFSTKKNISISKLHLENDEAPNLETVHPVDNMREVIEKACDDIIGNELQTSGIETQNRDCPFKLSASGKRQKQTKSYGPNKRKNTMSCSRLTSLNKALPSKSGEVSQGEEMPKMESSAEKENLDSAVVELKRKLDNDFKTSEKEKLDNGVAELKTNSNHGSKTPSLLDSFIALTSKNSNCITSLQSLPTNDNSVLPKKKGRKPGINRKTGVKKSYRSEIENATSKEEVRDFDLNVSNGVETCDPRVELTADKKHESFSDLTSEAAQLKPDALDDNQQHFSEQGNIAAKGFISNEDTVSFSTLVEKHHDIASTEKPKKRGRPAIKKRKSSELDKLDPAIKETKDWDENASSVIKAKPLDNHLAPEPGVLVPQSGSPNALFKEKSDISPSPRLNSSPYESNKKNKDPS